MGITALISTILGLLGGVLPDVLKEVRDSRAAARELEFQRQLHEQQLERMKLEAGNRLQDAQNTFAGQDLAALKETVVAAIEAGAKPSGVAWIDGLNALVRPVATVFIIALFMVTAAAFVFAVLEQYRAGQISSAREMAEVIWGSMVGFSIEAVLGFLFGARQARKLPVGQS